jgi:hypothetical protein
MSCSSEAHILEHPQLPPIKQIKTPKQLQSATFSFPLPRSFSSSRWGRGNGGLNFLFCVWVVLVPAPLFQLTVSLKLMGRPLDIVPVLLGIITLTSICRVEV